jgi:hypothetical protein
VGGSFSGEAVEICKTARGGVIHVISAEWRSITVQVVRIFKGLKNEVSGLHDYLCPESVLNSGKYFFYPHGSVVHLLGTPILNFKRPIAEVESITISFANQPQVRIFFVVKSKDCGGRISG